MLLRTSKWGSPEAKYVSEPTAGNETINQILHALLGANREEGREGDRAQYQRKEFIPCCRLEQAYLP